VGEILTSQAGFVGVVLGPTTISKTNDSETSYLILKKADKTIFQASRNF